MSRYSVSILFCLFICSGLWAAVKADDDALLLKLDKMIEHREVYQQKVEKEIADIRRTLDYAEDSTVYSWSIAVLHRNGNQLVFGLCNSPSS